MKKKVLDSLEGLSLAYSTNKDYKPEETISESEGVAKSAQKVRVQLYTKLKAGKSVSRIYGLEENQDSLEELCKFIKQKCGLGGSVKDGEIIIQGDQVEKIIKILIDKGYKNTKRSGG
jgi:translation initiation factor 1